jgi:hypothetical protein
MCTVHWGSLTKYIYIICGQAILLYRKFSFEVWVRRRKRS